MIGGSCDNTLIYVLEYYLVDLLAETHIHNFFVCLRRLNVGI